MPTALSHRPEVFISCSCNGPMEVFLVIGFHSLPVLIQALRFLQAWGSLLSGTGAFHTHQAGQKKRARRKHFCFLKAVWFMYQWQELDQLPQLGLRGKGVLFLSGQSAPGDGEQGFW